jgi:hypothetical protein
MRGTVLCQTGTLACEGIEFSASFGIPANRVFGELPMDVRSRELKLLKTPFSGGSLEDLLLGEGVGQGSQMGGGPQARERRLDRPQ